MLIASPFGIDINVQKVITMTAEFKGAAPKKQRLKRHE